MIEPSPIVHITIPSPDLVASKAFYEGVFGWTVEKNTPGKRYWFFRSGSLGGGLDADAAPWPEGLTINVRVDDIDATLRRVESLGGKVQVGRRRIGDAASGYDAYFLDCNGNKIGLYSEAEDDRDSSTPSK